MKTDYGNIKNFGYSLFAQTIGDKNPLISPISAWLTLSLAGCGADGATKTEFYSVLGKNMETLSDVIKDRLTRRGNLVKLCVSNAAWIDESFVPDKEWLDTVKRLAGAEVFLSDLSTKETMDAINRWSIDKTNGMIERILTKPLDSRVMLALFNTIYFKGEWAFPFQEYDTEKEMFYMVGNSGTSRLAPDTKQVDMMNKREEWLDYISNDFVEGVILPYRTDKEFGFDEKSPYDMETQMLLWNPCGDLAFVAVKPRGGISIREAYRRLDAQTMDKLIQTRNSEKIDLKLPRFEVVFDKVLNESLIHMGLARCFDAGKADFASMGKSQRGDRLYVDLVRQKARMIVNERGTEAAAETELLAALCAVFDVKKLYFDEPFLYLIMDMGTNMPLFIGILDDPDVNQQSWDADPSVF